MSIAKCSTKNPNNLRHLVSSRKSKTWLILQRQLSWFPRRMDASDGHLTFGSSTMGPEGRHVLSLTSTKCCANMKSVLSLQSWTSACNVMHLNSMKSPKLCVPSAHRLAHFDAIELLWESSKLQILLNTSWRMLSLTFMNKNPTLMMLVSLANAMVPSVSISRFQIVCSNDQKMPILQTIRSSANGPHRKPISLAFDLHQMG